MGDHENDAAPVGGGAAPGVDFRNIAAVLMLPVASLWVPAWHLPAPAAWSEAAAVFQVSATAADDPESATIGRSNPATAQTGHIAVRNWRAIIFICLGVRVRAGAAADVARLCRDLAA